MEKASPGLALPLAFRWQPLAGPLVYGVRLWISVCLALYVAFYLQLDNPFWAGTSAAIVCLPQRGASLRKAPFRLVGTIAGAIFIVILSGAFPQDRVALLLGLALWCANASFWSTVLQGYASYAGALSGYTAAIIAADELGMVGGTNGEVFWIAVARTTEIGTGIAAAGVVLAATAFGNAKKQLEERLAAMIAMIGAGFSRAWSGETAAASRETRRTLLRSASALYETVEEAAAESSEIRYRSSVLQNALDGLLASISGWSVVANHIERLPPDRAREDADAILMFIPPDLQKALNAADAKIWIEEASRLQLLAEEASVALYAMPAESPSLRLLADRAARTLGYLSAALKGLAFLKNPMGELRPVPRKKLRVPDFLPAFVNSFRALLTMAAVSLFWIVTAWPGGAGALVMAAVGSILIAPRADPPFTAAMETLIGIIITVILARTMKFSVLPQFETFAGLSLALSLIYIPLGAALTQPWRTRVFSNALYFFLGLASPTNEMVYDAVRFYNSALATVGGLSAVLVALLVLPPVPAPLRARRLLALTLRDFRRLAAKPAIPSVENWVGRTAGRLSALPDQARPAQFAALGTALSAGAELIRLRRLASSFGFSALLDPSLEAIALGQSELAVSRLAEADAKLSMPGEVQADADVRIGARAKIYLISESLARYGAYFDGQELA